MSDISLKSGQSLEVPPPRRRRWRRWVLSGMVALVVLIVLAVLAVLKLQPSPPPPLGLPTGAAAAPAGPLDGTWHVATGSVAGFRVRESVLGIGNDVTGRTSDVTGTALVTTGQVASATFRVDLSTIAVNGKERQPQFVQSLDVTAYPVATITLVRPVALPGSFSSGAEVTAKVAATLELNGRTRPVTVTLSARREGTLIDASGSLPVAFSDFGIKGPPGYGAFGSLASNGTAEFRLVFAPTAAG